MIICLCAQAISEYEKALGVLVQEKQDREVEVEAERKAKAARVAHLEGEVDMLVKEIDAMKAAALSVSSPSSSPSSATAESAANAWIELHAVRHQKALLEQVQNIYAYITKRKTDRQTDRQTHLPARTRVSSRHCKSGRTK